MELREVEMLEYEVCPICDGIGLNFVGDSVESACPCWGCKGEGKIYYQQEVVVSENDIKTIFSLLKKQR